ncbi:hypothetical protein GYA49_02555 [Candidatus Beckwithbacteria bacterium]|nr:hypothetical protein [Candidatus Beckwithbacteria bacterium]
MAQDKKLKSVVSTLQKFLTHGGQVDELRSVVTEFNNLLEEEERQNQAKVVTAYELSDGYKKQVTSTVDSFFGKELEYEFVVDKALIAGIKVQVYDEIIDLSLDSALNSINQQLKH